MSPFPSTLVKDSTGRQYLTIYTSDGALPPVVADDHPHFDALRAMADDPEATADDIRELADLSVAVASKFDRLSERVSVANGRVYFDGDELDDSITRHIVRCLDEGLESWRPYVSFLENIAANPNEHSREQLFDWLRAHEFTIDAGGEIIAYKGVRANDDGTFSPSNSWGYGIVDGERQERIKQRIGSVVELPRSEVRHDPRASCSFGLHVGTHSYAQGYAEPTVLKVAVNPRDVVSVPSDAGGEKVRVCRYRVLATIDAPVTEPFDHDDAVRAGELDDPETCGWCGRREAVYTDVDGDYACKPCADERPEYAPYTEL